MEEGVVLGVVGDPAGRGCVRKRALWQLDEEIAIGGKNERERARG
jgi:hypothetical protein